MSLSPASSPAASDQLEPYPLPFLTSSETSSSTSGPAQPSDSTRSPKADGSSGGQDSTSTRLIRFLPIAEPGNGPQEALNRMRRLARESEGRTSGAPNDAPVVSSAKYTTSADVRGYIPVYEFPLGEQVLMIDSENGLVHWTSIWKLLGNSKADMVRLVEMQPEVGALLKKVRGGYLKIQGTWLPYDIALNLSRRVAYPIRESLTSLFGPTFPASCITPSQPGFGQITLSAPGTSTRRGRQKRATAPSESRRPPPSSPRGRQTLHPALSQHRLSDQYANSAGPQRHSGSYDSRYTPYPTSYPAPPPPPEQLYSASSYPPPPAHYTAVGFAPGPVTSSIYPEASSRYYPPPPVTVAATVSDPSLTTYRFPAAPASASAPPTAHPGRLPMAAPPTTDRGRYSGPVAGGRATGSLSITQLLHGDTPPDTPFSLPLPLAGVHSYFSSPIPGDQQQLSVLDGAMVARRGSQQFKRLQSDREDYTPSSTCSSIPQISMLRRDSLPSPFRSMLPALSLADRRSPSFKAPLIPGSSRLETEKEDDALSAHSSSLSSPRTSDGSHSGPVVIRSDSRDDTDDRSRTGSFNSTLGVYFGPLDTSAPGWGKGHDKRFPSVAAPGPTASGQHPYPLARAHTDVSTSTRPPMAKYESEPQRRTSLSSEHFQRDHVSLHTSSERSSLSNLSSTQKSPLRPW